MDFPSYGAVAVPSLDRSAMEELNAGAPSWVVDARRRGFEWFKKLDQPTAADEAWKYVHLDFELERLHLAEQPGAPLAPHPMTAPLAERAGTGLVVDGKTVAVDDVTPVGCVLTSLGDAFTAEQGRLRGAYAQGVMPDVDAFAAAHQAFSSDGIFLYVTGGAVIQAPVVVELQATVPDTVSFPHVTVVAEPNSEASIVILSRSSPEARLVVVPQIEISVRDGARVRLTTIQDLDYQATSVTHQRVTVGRDAAVTMGEVGLGGRLGRLDLGVALLGSGANSDLVGIYFGEEEQVLDYRVVVDHRGKNTRSDIFLKGAVEDRAQSVFTGLLKIWPDATKTSTFETNRNLVLSDGAKAHSVPNLEILCDDVMCGHGSTVGPLEEEHLYYLMSRGLPEDRAARLLVRGFFEEIIKRLPATDLADPIRAAVNRKFVEAQREGRV